MDKQSKIYIAGHDGLVGSAFVRKLQSDGYNNLVYKHYTKLDLRRQLDTEKFFQDEKPDVVILCAAKVGGIHANNTFKAEFIYDNIMIATNVINSAFKFGVKKLLNLGSSCIYPKLASQPLKEEYLLTGLLEPTNEPYAIAKISAIKLCKFYNEQYGTDFISVMPTNMFGENDNFDFETSHVLPALLRKFHLAKLLSRKNFDLLAADMKRFGNSMKDLNTDYSSQKFIDAVTRHLGNYGIKPGSVVLWGTGKPYREFMLADDLADAGLYLLQNCSSKDIGDFVNIGTGEDVTIAEIAVAIKKIVGFEGEIEWNSEMPDGTPKKQLNIEKLTSLGWNNQTDLLDSLEKYYTWYREELEKCNYAEKEF